MSEVCDEFGIIPERYGELRDRNAELLSLLRECRPMTAHCLSQTEHALLGKGCASPSFTLSGLRDVLARIDTATKG